MGSNRSSFSEMDQSSLQQMRSPDLRPLLLAGVVLGLGQGGFFDGIVFHQLLQWHHMFSSIETDMTVAGMELNTLGDGLFHLFDWLLTLSGIALLWRAGVRARDSWLGRVFVGALLLGAGIFNLVEGIINHHILGIHHLKPGVNQGLWDIAFLASGILLIGVGVYLIRTTQIRRAI
jgi:uncharacterized membrane protein